jgi:two-component system NtrC family response regulator
MREGRPGRSVMGGNHDRSPVPNGASNDGRPDAATGLARACRRAGEAPDRASALGAILDELRVTSGAERGFILEAGAAARRGRVLAATTPAAAGAISWTLAARALAGERPLVLADLSREALGWDGASWRALELRAAVAMPVPRRGGPRTAILLDSRAPLPSDLRFWEGTARAFSSLAALVLNAESEAFGRSRAELPLPSFAGASAAARRLAEEVVLAAPVPLPALVLGASGTGKELVARALHDRSPRRRAPFVAINCAAIPDTLLERELFGAVRGAYTGADRDHAGLFRRAAGGTLFLDEIGDMPLTLQAKLLRVLQDGAVRPVGGLEETSVDVRVVAATHRDLARLVAEGAFRDDLRYRLAVLVLRVPSLAERGDDIRALAGEILDRLAARCAVPRPDLQDDAVAALRAHSWPGNVRELEAVLGRALVRARGRAIGRPDLDFDPAGGAPPPERARILDALARSRGNVTAAAAGMGWTRQALYRRMDALEVPRPRGTGRRQGSGAA